MGEVYRGRDTKLERDVAIKILPESFATDPDRLMRFEREAKTLASLNHPNIAAIYGIESNALVMELVEGDDLSQRIARGPIPLDEALAIAKQIAEALEAAHEQGIIHRDLKPANVKVRPDGAVKVLDFGLAKTTEQGSGIGDQGSGPLANSPTMMSPAMTMRGVILGTAAYMSPEQAKGKPVDRRADIWAFGCVLYEMLAGKRTFAGEDISDTLVSVLRDDPRWAALPPDTPPQVRTLLRRCLQKDPQKRLPHIGTARLDLAESSITEGVAALSPPPSRRVSAAIAGVVIGAVGVGIIAFAMTRRPEVPDSRPPVRFAIEPLPGSFFPGGNQVPRFAVSPDGTMVVYQQQDSSASQLWIRQLEAVESRPLPGTMSTSAGGLSHQQPFWSPDGRYLGYFDEPASQVKKLNLQTGAVQTLAAISGNQLAGSWSDANVILISSVGSRGVQRVPADGGTPVAVTTLDPATLESAHLWPDFLPDGKHFVYLATYANEMESAVFVGSLDGGSPKRLFASSAMARAAWPNRLLFVREGALVSQQFDLDRLELTGKPAVVLNDIPVTAAGRVGVSASRTGVLVHSDGRAGADSGDSAWVDRAGRDIQPAPPSVGVGISGIRLSRDGRYLIYARTAIERNGRRLSEVWIQDTQRGIESRLSTDLALGGSLAVFSSDGSHVWFRRAGDSVAIVQQAISGAVPAQVVIPTTPTQQVLPHDALPDGRLLFSITEPGRLSTNASRMMLLPPGPAQTPVPYLNGVYALYGATFSPDGHWVAYSVGTTVQNRQVFIQPFPNAAGGKWPVSAAGGGFPRWRGDGRELYFSDRNRRVMAVPVSTTPVVDIGTPTALFQLEPQTVANPYDVTPDGQRFVILRNKGLAETPARMIVTVDWLRAIDTMDAGAR